MLLHPWQGRSSNSTSGSHSYQKVLLTSLCGWQAGKSKQHCLTILTAWAVGFVVPKLGAQRARDLLGLVAAGSRQVPTLATAIASWTRSDLAQVVVKVPAARVGERHEQWTGAGAGMG